MTYACTRAYSHKEERHLPTCLDTVMRTGMSGSDAFLTAILCHVHHVYLYTYTHSHTHAFTHSHIYMYSYIRAGAHGNQQQWRLSNCTPLPCSSRIPIYMYINILVRKHRRVVDYAQAHILIYALIHTTYIHICIYSHIHTFIYSYTGTGAHGNQLQQRLAKCPLLPCSLRIPTYVWGDFEE